jgi:drug/metabolite transporter (DMT)-like permease
MTSTQRTGQFSEAYPREQGTSYSPVRDCTGPAPASNSMAFSKHSPIALGVLLAIASALSFGFTTPLIAQCGAGAGPLGIAALLYAGAALSSVVARPLAKKSGRALGRSAVPRLLLIALFGAALAPTLLAWGLASAGATGSSLVLNFEAIFTVLLARIAYREHVGLRVGLAVAVMSVGGGLIGFDATRTLDRAHIGGLLLVLAATASWALDNTLTRGLAEEDPLDVVAAKASLGASATAGLAFALGESLPAARDAIALLACGATGYGLSLLFYLQAQRHIGAVRTSSVFATGPFVGAGLAWLLGDRQAGWATAFGALAFGVGVLLHLTERHSHAHVHQPLDHEHPHRHDDGHHAHQHEPAIAGEHTHWHRHELAEHEHEHAPDIHHGHEHS